MHAPTRLAFALCLAALVGGSLAQERGLGPGAPILIGQSGGFSGGQAEYAADVRLGIEAAFAEVNRSGGLFGRSLKLVTADDGGRRDAVLANTKTLVERDRVLALIGYTSGAGTEGALPYLAEAKVPLLSPATGNMGIRAAHHPYLFHTRAGYADEMNKIVGHVASLGLSRVGLAYLADVGPANLKSMTDALAAHGLKPVAVVGPDRNAEDFTPQVNALLAGRPDLVVFISNARPIVKIVSAMRQRGYHGQFATSSFAGSRVVADLEKYAPGLIMIQVLPQPHKDYMTFHREFHADIRRQAPAARGNYTVLEGYIAARTLIEGLRRAGPEPNRERLATALAGLGELAFGNYRVRYAKGNHAGSRFVDLGVVTDEGRLRF
jgi:ABC-type branched-subunit amino acid transport system substrate-binding protein